MIRGIVAGEQKVVEESLPGNPGRQAASELGPNYKSEQKHNIWPILLHTLTTQLSTMRCMLKWSFLNTQILVSLIYRPCVVGRTLFPVSATATASPRTLLAQALDREAYVDKDCRAFIGLWRKNNDQRLTLFEWRLEPKAPHKMREGTQ